ncbi:MULTISPECIES: hypothetical protein [Bacillaceae]|uniref:hypothetical protein n=1 Tax=Bacillaceae TaxID=186817 RepID=UPI002FFDE804
MKLKRLKHLEQKIQERESRNELEEQKVRSQLLIDFIQSNQEAKFYFRTIWRWSVGSMTEESMERHNRIYQDKSSNEYQHSERFHKSTGLGNEYRYRIDYPEVLKKKFYTMFFDWQEKMKKGKKFTEE